MRTHILQHVPFEDIGSIKSWLETRQAEITYTRFFQNDPLPEIHGLNLLIVLGGPMSANDQDVFPWLHPEKAFIRKVVKKGIPTLGICLGAQLIASALGARIYKQVQKEIGWFEIEATPCLESCFRLPERFLGFHWHGETFDLPAGAIRLASSKGCENQAFQIGKHVVGLQFHLETTQESVGVLIDNCRGELAPGSFVQSERELLQVEPAAYIKINSLMSDLLLYLVGAASAGTDFGAPPLSR